MGEWKETSIGRLPNDWEVGLFEADLKIQGRIGWKGYKQTDLVEEGPFVIGGTEINSSIHLDLSSAPHLSREKYEESPEIMLGDKDVLLVTRGNLGQVGLYRKEYGEATINPSVIILKDFVGHPEFLFYYLISRPGNYNVMSLASGSSVPAIYQSEVKTLEYPKPPLAEQRAIASVLSSLDAKIDLLHRQNKTLEAMAEALFRQWFVDGERRSLGEGDEAEEGWEEVGLLDVVKLVPGGTPKTTQANYWDGDIMWISVREISENHKGFVNYAYKTITEEGLDNSAANLLPKFGTVISARGTVGKIALLAQPMAYSQSNFGVLPKNSSNYFFTYMLVHNSIEELHSNSYGAVFDTITTQSFQTIRHRLPGTEVINSFEALVRPMFLKMLNNTEQITSLTKLRDTLLPKLMSGEVRVEMN